MRMSLAQAYAIMERQAGIEYVRGSDVSEARKVIRGDKWDRRYLGLAKYWATTCSKDPSTQVGAVLVSADGDREYLGYNGFPRGVNDDMTRYIDKEQKYARVVHAELNAILKAGYDCQGATLFVWPLFSCNECAKAVIQSGVARIVALRPNEERWMSAYDVAIEMYHEAGVQVEMFNEKDGSFELYVGD